MVVKHSCISTETHYYPGGLPIANISSVAFDAKTNPYQYQGDNAEQDDETGWNDFELRTYDPQTMRWLQVDPYDEFASPYVGMGNDPVNNIDPDGGDLFGLIAKEGMYSFSDQLTTGAEGFAIGALAGWAANGFKSSISDVLRNGFYGAAGTLGLYNTDWTKVGNALGDAGSWLGNHLPSTNLFTSMDNAALNWAKKYNGSSIKEGQEYGSTFYETKSGKYKYTPPAKGGNAAVTPSQPPNGFQKKGDIHSHGKYEALYDNNNFSKTDKADNRKNKIPGYLSTPNGTLQKFVPKTNKVTTLSKEIPSDPKDPDRQNKISP